MRKRALVTPAVAVAALTVGALASAGTAGAQQGTQARATAHKTLAHSTPKWQNHARRLGKTNNSQSVSLRVYLQPNGGSDALSAFVDAVSTPGSALYHKYLTPQQYHQRFDATPSQVKAVTQWLAGAGLKVGAVDLTDSYVQVTGTVGEAQAAFTTTVDNYAHDGQQVHANASALQVPTTVAGFVAGVSGLDSTVVRATPNTADAPAGFVNAKPCSIYYGQLTAKYEANYQTKLPKFNGSYLPYAVCGYTGPQFRAAYENNSSLDGTGATVAIVDAYASPYNFSDAQTYARNNGDAGYAPGQYRQVVAKPFTNQQACGEEGWWGEEALDTQAVHAMAGGAKIIYYGAASCYDNDLLDALNKVINQHKAQIVSDSWGEPDEGVGTDNVVAYVQAFQKAAATGISVLFSSGDNGDELQNTGVKQADSPASNPYVTAVGGTATGIDASGRLVLQTGWGTDKYSLSANAKKWTPVGYLYGAGGGYSDLFNRPGYQNGVVPASAPAGRAVPDVAMDADPTTGMLVGQTQQFPDGVHYGQYRIGGTSLASPLFAGMTALRIQANYGSSLGFLNPTIYNNTSKFTDVAGAPADQGNVRVDYANGVNPSGGLLYSVRTFNQDATLTVTQGWDDVTGVGVPNTGWFKP